MTSNRRDFLRLSALAAAAGCTISFPRNAFAAPGSSLTYGVQLFMVRKEISDGHLAEILAEIHKVGFNQVELFPPLYNHPPAELKKILADAGVSSISGHFDYAGFEDKIDYAKQLGLMFMICPMVPEDQWTPGGFTKAAADFNRWGKAVKDAGMTFCFHNHCYEFKPLDSGKTGWQTLMDNTDPALVKLELDIYWLTQAGQDPAAILAKYSDRARVLHLKERTPGAPTGFTLGPEANHMTELGKNGSINWPSLFAQAKKQGIKYAFVDQDETSVPIDQSLKENFAYLKKLKA